MTNQILPTNRDQSYTADNRAVRAQLWYPFDDTANEFVLVGYAADTKYNHTIHIELDVKEPGEPDIMEAIVILAKSMETLADWLRTYM
jgi:23S rRNA A2030 N6-methylase RlmJ